MKLLREAATDSSERCTAILPGSQTIESRSRCAKPSRMAKARAYILFPEPELPKTRTFMWLNESIGVELGRDLVFLLQIDHRFFASLRMMLWGCEAIGEFPQEWFHVCGHADRL